MPIAILVSPKAWAAKMNHKRIDTIAKAICQSGKFETGQGTCALICMDQLGDARRNCLHAVSVHNKLATQIEKAICHEFV